MNTNVEYLGLKLKSPILAGSCGLTANADNLCRLEAPLATTETAMSI